MPPKVKGTAPAPETEDTLQRKAYTNATTRLREAHREQFEQFRAEEAGKLGVTYSRRKTKEEREREVFEKMLAEHPDWVPEPPDEDPVIPAGVGG